jgi:hypothetical protein
MLIFVESAAEPVPSTNIEVREFSQGRSSVQGAGAGCARRPRPTATIQTRHEVEQAIEEDAAWCLRPLWAGAMPLLAGVANGTLAVDDPQEAWAETTPGLSPQILCWNRLANVVLTDLPGGPSDPRSGCALVAMASD